MSPPLAFWFAIALLLVQLLHGADAQRVRSLNYPNCILLENANTRVMLCPDAGGRVLEYAWKNVNALHLDPLEANWDPATPGRKIPVSAGRFDIGPEQVIPRRDELWSGVWTGEITGARSARLTSPKHEATGVQLLRDFELAPDSSRLICRQTIRNVSQRTVEWCHWSRTFAEGGGIVYIPLTTPSRFPNAYVMYGAGNTLNFRPQDPNIRTRDGFLEISGAPAFPKLGMDSYADWFAYQEKSGLLFVKRFRTFPDRVYNEVAALTISIWYPKEMRVCELEPIGPRERLKPGESAAFTEEWWLLENAWPAEPGKADLQEIRRLVETQTKPPE
ncbi:MAG: DUF4380 domain-containing protein [Verrucomicrobiota bacterium]|nr:DUF4380 domain-containing protein [Verrucomicrobiota bacterium]